MEGSSENCCIKKQYEDDILTTSESENDISNKGDNLLQSPTTNFLKIADQSHIPSHSSLFEKLSPETRDFLSQKFGSRFTSNPYQEKHNTVDLVEVRTEVDRLIGQQTAVTSSSQQFVDVLTEFKRTEELVSCKMEEPSINKEFTLSTNLDSYVYQWLLDLKLPNTERYISIFAENEIDEESLFLLSEFNLRQMGISAIGPLNKLMNAIQTHKRTVSSRGKHVVAKSSAKDHCQSTTIVNKPMRFTSKPLSVIRSRSLSAEPPYSSFKYHSYEKNSPRSPSVSPICDRMKSLDYRQIHRKFSGNRSRIKQKNSRQSDKSPCRGQQSLILTRNANHNIAKLAEIDISLTVERRKAKQRIEQTKKAMEKKLAQILRDRRIRLAIESQRRHNDMEINYSHFDCDSRKQRQKSRTTKAKNSRRSSKKKVESAKEESIPECLSSPHSVHEEAIGLQLDVYHGKEDVLTQFHIDSKHPAIVFEDQLNELELRIQNLLDQKQLKQGEPRTLMKSIDQLQNQLLEIQDQVYKQRTRIAAVKKKPPVPVLEPSAHPFPAVKNDNFRPISVEHPNLSVTEINTKMFSSEFEPVKSNPPAIWTGNGSVESVERSFAAEIIDDRFLERQITAPKNDDVKTSAFRQIARNCGALQTSKHPNYENVMKGEIHYDEIDHIGEGAFTEVFRGRYHGSDVTVKRLKLSLSMIDKDAFVREINELSKLYHPHIVPVITCSCQGKVPLVLSQLVSGSCLQDLLKRPDPLDHSAFYQICEDTAAGLAYLHSKLHCHGRLTSRNLLLSHQLRAQISDVGLGRWREIALRVAAANGGDERDTGDVSPAGHISLSQLAWSAPELLSTGDGGGGAAPATPPSPASDVYSLGVLIWEMLARRRPYDLLTAGQTRDRILATGQPLTISPSCPAGLRQLLGRAWDAQPDNRPSAQEVKLLFSQLKFPPAWLALFHSSGVPSNTLHHIPTCRLLIATVLRMANPCFLAQDLHIPLSGPCGLLANPLPPLPAVDEDVDGVVVRIRAAIQLPSPQLPAGSRVLLQRPASTSISTPQEVERDEVPLAPPSEEEYRLSEVGERVAPVLTDSS